MFIKFKYNYSARQYLLFFAAACVLTLIAFAITTGSAEEEALPTSAAVQTEIQPERSTDSDVISGDFLTTDSENTPNNQNSKKIETADSASENNSAKNEDSSSKENSSKSSTSSKTSSSNNESTVSKGSTQKSGSTSSANSSLTKENTSAKTTSSKSENTSSKTTSSKSESTSSKTTSSKSENTSSKTTSSKSESTSSKTTSSKSENTSSKTTSSKNESAVSKVESSVTDKNTSSAKTQSDTDKTESKSDSSKKSSDSDKTASGTDTDSKPKTKTPPKEYHIDVEHISQNGVLPTGCEIVSTKMVLDYYGMERLSLDDILDHLKCSELKLSKDGKLYGLSPFQAFIGNPKKTNGFGCYPPVIMDMIEDFDFGALYAEDTSSLPLDFVAETYVTQDIPVLVWVTMGMVDSYLTDSWYLCDENGKITKNKYTWRAEEHCMVLIGYDEKYYYFCDPLSEKDVVKYKKSLVEKRYKEIGSYSMIIRRGTNPN